MDGVCMYGCGRTWLAEGVKEGDGWQVWQDVEGVGQRARVADGCRAEGREEGSRRGTGQQQRRWMGYVCVERRGPEGEEEDDGRRVRRRTMDAV